MINAAETAVTRIVSVAPGCRPNDCLRVELRPQALKRRAAKSAAPSPMTIGER